MPSVVGGLAQQVERGAHHLRLAAQAIGVLHALVVRRMRGADRRCRAISRAAHPRLRSGRDGARSAWMRGSNGVSDPLAASVESAPVTSAGWNSALGLEQPGQRIGGRELRAVEQRQAFLGAERQRREAGVAHAPSAAGSRAGRR